MKKNIIIIIVLAFTIISGLIYFAYDSSDIITKEKVIMKAIFHPAGTDSETYCIYITENRRLIYTMGVRKNDSFNKDNFFEEVETIKYIVLNEEDFQEILSIVNLLKQNPPKGESLPWTDVWIAVLACDEFTYSSLYYSETLSDTASQLFEKLIEFSPINIYLRDFS